MVFRLPGSVWEPPEEPDLQQILQSARQDTRQGLYDQALAKFSWFNEASRNAPGMGGVRLSFALSYWMELGEVYPPAREAFVRTRDETELAVRRDSSGTALFYDVAAFNRSLGEHGRTVTLFLEIAELDAGRAAMIYGAALPALLAERRYDVCGRFLNPPEQLELAEQRYRMHRAFEEQQRFQSPHAPPVARKFYVHDTATLVALLVLNGRDEEARASREAALRILDDPEFRVTLDEALAGRLPELLQLD